MRFAQWFYCGLKSKIVGHNRATTEPQQEFMKKNKENQRGFIAITSLLIISTIAMVLAMSMLMDGVNNATLSLDSIHYEGARINVKTCLEDTLLRLRQEEQFSQNLNYQITDRDSCSTEMQWFSPQVISPTRTERLLNLTITGVSDVFERTFRYELKVVRFEVSRPDDSVDYLNTIEFISIDELTP